MLRHMRSRAGVRPPRFIIAVLLLRVKISIILLVACALYTSYSLSKFSVEKTSIDENALLPGLVDDSFADASLITHHVSRMEGSSTDRRKLLSYVEEELRRLRLETCRQNFTTKSTIFFKDANSSGENVLGIVRAPRSAPFESILVVVRIASISSIAFALSLAAHAKEQIYWARDVTFLFVDGDKLAMEAWLSAFYGSQHDFIIAGKLEARAGPIIGAFVLDVNGVDNFRAVNIQYGMVNGRLPNMDLVNLFTLLSEKYGASPTFYNVVHDSRTGYKQDLAVLLYSRAIISQSFTELENLHSVLGGYGVNAVTLQAAEREYDLIANEAQLSGRTNRALKTLELARVAEGAMRSLNNILEKLHHSYFLYFLTHTHRFVSVAFYMPIIGLMIVPLLFFALYDWFCLKYGEEYLKTMAKLIKKINDESAEELNEKADESFVENDANNLDVTQEQQKTRVARNERECLGAVFGLVFTHLISLLFYALLISLFSSTTRSTLLNFAPKFAKKLFNELSVTNVSALTILLPPLVICPAAIFFGKINNTSHYHFLRFFTACEIALLFGALSLLNFSLAFSLSLIFMPFAMFTFTTGRKTSVIKKVFGFGVFNPFSVATSLCIILERYNFASFGAISAFNFEAEAVRAVWTRLVRWVALTARNHFIHSSALFPILTILCLTIFNALTQILLYEDRSADVLLPDDENDKERSKKQFVAFKKEKTN